MKCSSFFKPNLWAKILPTELVTCKTKDLVNWAVSVDMALSALSCDRLVRSLATHLDLLHSPAGQVYLFNNSFGSKTSFFVFLFAIKECLSLQLPLMNADFFLN